jgi:alanine-synthesizing transaminase
MIQAAERIENYHYAIRQIVTAAEALVRRGREVIYLNIGDPQVYGFRPPEHIVAAVTRALKDGFTGYAHSSGLPEAREAVANYATGLGVPTRSADVIITSGASEAADLILTTLLNAGDEVLIPGPGYPIYPAILSKLGATARYYQLDSEHDWQPSLENVGSLINERTRALVLINPNNPAGSITADQITRELLELAARKNVLVISDEVYRDLCFAQAPTSAAVLAQGMDSPLITLESLSKTHLVPGWRTGWMRFSNADKMPELIQGISRLAGGRLCAPTPTQYAVRPALEGSREFQQTFLCDLRRRRDFAVAQVRSIPGLSCYEPQAAFYMMIKVDDLGGRTDERFVLDVLEETGTLLVHGSGFGAAPEAGYFRMVYLADEATLKIVFDRLREFMAKSRG